MDRKRLLSLVAVLIFLAPACALPVQENPLTQSETATAASAAGQTATAAASLPTSTPAPTDTVAAPTGTLPAATSPAATVAAPSATPTPAATPTGPPPAPISAACPLLDGKAIGAVLGDKIVATKKLSPGAGVLGCQWYNQSLNTYLTLLAAQDEAAVKYNLTFYAEFAAAKNCARPVAASPDAVTQAQTQFDKLQLAGNVRVRESLDLLASLIQNRSCADAYGFLLAPRLGDIAFSERAFGLVTLHVVDQNTVLSMSGYRQGMANQDMLAGEASLMASVLKEIEAQ